MLLSFAETSLTPSFSTAIIGDVRSAVRCETIFTDSNSNSNSGSDSSVPRQKPDIGKFMRSPFLKNLLQNISQKVPSDQPRILVAKLRNIRRSRLAGLFTLFILLWPRTSFSQQSLFNAPSIEPTEKHKFFFQEQVNVLPKEGISNTTLDYGLGKGWSVGASLFNIKGYTAETNYVDPDVLANIEKAIQVTSNWRVGFGTQSGFNTGNNSQRISQFKSFSYFQNMVSLPQDWGKFYFGYYHANTAFTGDKNADGAMMGVEIPLVKEKLSFMADYLSGTSPISVAVLGMVYTMDNKTQISAGAQIPSPGSDNDYGMVLELTVPTF